MDVIETNDSKLLNQLRNDCEVLGYDVRDAPLFADIGISVSKSTTVRSLQLMERLLHVYPKGGTWQILVAWHCPPQQWVKSISDTAGLEHFVVSVIEGRDEPPVGWTQV